MFKGFTIWFTGLPCSGKTTLANMLIEKLSSTDIKVQNLDGDVIRGRLNSDLGFSKADRDENIRRVIFLCELLTGNGVVAVTSFVSPYREIRDEARAQLKDFVEVYVKCDLQTCIQRDVKGLYKKAIRGEIKEFTGISDPYEPPVDPEIVVETDRKSPEECVQEVLNKLIELGYWNTTWGTSLPHGGKLVNRVLEGQELAQAMENLDSYKKVPVGIDVLLDSEKVAVGAFSPLEGFMSRNELESVVCEMKLPDGEIWPIPILCYVNEETAMNIDAGEKVALMDDRGNIISLLDVSDKYKIDKDKLVKSVFATADLKHPGVKRVYEEGDWALAGKVSLVRSPVIPLKTLELYPKDTRRIFANRGWKTITGFQTRNAPHRAHEQAHRMALELGDGLFINPIFGPKKAGDFSNNTIVNAYLSLMENYYPKDRVVFGGLFTAMRYAGPKEAVFHSIIRKNYGCTHFIVGRDHAGVGSYYDPYAAHKLLDEVGDLGIEIIKMEGVFYCKKCAGLASIKSCSHGDSHHINISMTDVREMIKNEHEPPYEMVRPEVMDSLRDADEEASDEEKIKERLIALGYLE